MRALTLPAAAGWQWITGGYAIYRRNPPMLTLMVLAYWFIVLLLNVFQEVGLVLASLLVPGLSVGLMQVARNIERGTPVSLQTLIGGLRENSRTLFALGALYLCCSLGIFGLVALADGGDLQQLLTAPVADDGPAAGPSLLPMLLLMLLITPVLMAYWFAPLLAAWHRQPLAKALFFSFIACWLNWRAFLAYSGGLLLLAGVLPTLLLAVLGSFLPGGVAVLVLVPWLLVLAPTLFASFYVSYRDVFGISEIV